MAFPSGATLDTSELCPTKAAIARDYRLDDRTDDCAYGANDVAQPGDRFRKLRFLMIADSPKQVSRSALLVSRPFPENHLLLE